MSMAFALPGSLRRRWAAVSRSCRKCGKLLWVLFLKLSGPPILLVMLTLPLYGKWGEFFKLLPRVPGVPLAGKVLLALVDLYLLVAGIYSTAMAALCDPGFAPPWMDDPEAGLLTTDGRKNRSAFQELLARWSPAEFRGLCADALASVAKGEQHEDKEESFPRRCGKCQRQRWPRTHHCSVCRRCVQRMDHHCPLINNCVGARNYRYFLLAVFHLWAGCLIYLSLCFSAQLPPSLEAATLKVEGSGLWTALLNMYFSGPEGIHGLGFQAEICWPWTLINFALTTRLLFRHGRLVLRNETSIEESANAKLRKSGREPKRTFDVGPRRNFQEVFGPLNPWTLRWLLPFGKLPVLGDHAATA